MALTIVTSGIIASPGSSGLTLITAPGGGGAPTAFVATIDLSLLPSANTIVLEMFVSVPAGVAVSFAKQTIVGPAAAPDGIMLGPFPSEDNAASLYLNQTVGTSVFNIPWALFSL